MACQRTLYSVSQVLLLSLTSCQHHRDNFSCKRDILEAAAQREKIVVGRVTGPVGYANPSVMLLGRIRG